MLGGFLSAFYNQANRHDANASLCMYIKSISEEPYLSFIMQNTWRYFSNQYRLLGIINGGHKATK